MQLTEAITAVRRQIDVQRRSQGGLDVVIFHAGSEEVILELEAALIQLAFGPTAFGHTGYTGCMIWVDPASGRFLILLTSRLYRNGAGDVQPLRRELAALVGGLAVNRSGL